MLGVLLAVALASPSGGFAFGRTGGNIVPFTVTVSRAGSVHVSGPVHVRRTMLTPALLGSLASVAARVRFATLPATTSCAGTLPDVAATFVRAGRRTVRVHGSCVTRYARLWNALAHAVGLAY